MSFKEEIDGKINPKILDLIVYPTEQCNFRCVYCYEDFELGKMSGQVVNAVKALISRSSKSVRVINLKWFGGEPLVAKDIIFEVGSHAMRHVLDGDVILNGSMTTNGYMLSSAVMQDLVKINHNAFQISLDGFGATHDATRRLASGNGTFDRIWGNLLDLSRTKLKFNIVIRVHLTQDNFDSVGDLLRRMADEFNDDERFSVYFKIVNQLSSMPVQGARLINRGDANYFINKAILLSEELKIRTVKSEMLKMCYASRPNSIAIRASGKLQKCTVLLNDADNDVGSLSHDGKLLFDRVKLLPWMEGLLSNDTDALGCPASSIAKKKGKYRVIPIEVF